MANLMSCLPWSPISVALHDLSESLPQCDQARGKAICSAKLLGSHLIQVLQ
jgi:hypothetical protein